MIRRAFPAVYLGWIAICGVLFVAMGDLEDPSRPKGRILSIDAGVRALSIVRARDPRFRDYEVVHVARARKGEGGVHDRWIVLLDRDDHTALCDAVVVELGIEDGRLLAIRDSSSLNNRLRCS